MFKPPAASPPASPPANVDRADIVCFSDSVKRGPAPKWQQQLEAIDQLPKSQQKFVAQMLDALIAQATTKASSEGREVLQ
ncbi:hypothetical protein [Pseudomonas gorinensis]